MWNVSYWLVQQARVSLAIPAQFYPWWSWCFSSYLLMSGHEVLLVHRRICERFVASWFVSMFDGRCGGSGAATHGNHGEPQKWLRNTKWSGSFGAVSGPARSEMSLPVGLSMPLPKWARDTGEPSWISRTTSFHAFHIPSLVLLARRNRATPTMTISITHVNASMNESVSVALITVWESPHWRNMRALRALCSFPQHTFPGFDGGQLGGEMHASLIFIDIGHVLMQNT